MLYAARWKNNCCLEQSLEKSTASTVPLFLGHPVYKATPPPRLNFLFLNTKSRFGKK